MSSLQFPVLQLLFWFYDVPQQAAVICLTKYYTTFPRQAPSSDIKKKRDLAHLLTIFYILGIVCTLYYTYTTLPENYYEIFGASCDNLDVVQLKRLFRRASLIYHPDKNAGPEAVDNFVRVRNAYDTLINDKKREMYNRVGPSVVTGYKTATALDYVDASVKRMVVDHAMSL
jgi:preprotein translocase subunit Sec63